LRFTFGPGISSPISVRRGRVGDDDSQGEQEVSMIWKKVTKVAATAGCAEGGTVLNAFDNALLAAGIGNVNLVKVSSIVPPDVDIVVPIPHIKPGSIVPTAYAAMTSETPGETVAAAVGYALPEDRTKAGVIMEFHDRTDRATAERAIRAMLAEAFLVRGERIRELEVVAVEHRVARVGCAVAAVALLSEEDIL
jgi:arginine decarboxylase